jgi:hypothetical protein
VAGGHLKKRVCMAKAKSKAKPKACKRLVPVGSVRVSEKAGKDTIAFPTVKLLRHMKPGHYKLVVSAIGPSNARSAAQSVSFTLR